jgi:OPA family glycerol-3-phosphate transporter-like MFS transporter/OPA family sugar phosphate sensor protein UhpC-like MFS transporter
MKDEKKFQKAQTTFIFSSMVVYAFFYLTRKNLSMAMPGMLEEGVISTYAVGTMLSLHGILYGLSRFVNGFWADRLNGRIFMTIGLALSALMNFCFGCTSLSVMFAVFWVLNGWTQGMGFPPCAKMLTHWIHPKELATKMSIWNTSHSFGAVFALGLCTLLLALGFGWRWCFYVPAVLAGLVAVFCFFVVKETPTEAGVEELEIEGVQAKADNASSVTTKDRMRLVFCNKVIWMVAISNFFVYIVRFGFLDWGPTFLKQFKGIPVAKGGLMTIAFELAAVVGTIFAGWITDKWFKGRGVRTCVFCMLFAALFSFGFWYLPSSAPLC